MKKSWTERQRHIFRLYAETGVQDEVAKQLKIAQQTVSKTLKSIAAAQVQLLEKGLGDWTENEFN